jgi:hypothetical protein
LASRGFFQQGQFREAKAFILLTEMVWKEYAPGLLDKVNEDNEKYSQLDHCSKYHVSMTEAKEIERDFIQTV